MEEKLKELRNPRPGKMINKFWQYYVIYISGEADGINRVWLVTIIYCIYYCLQIVPNSMQSFL